MIDDASSTDLAWLAGLLEGEGVFDLHRDRYPRIRIAMADRDVVERVASLMGCTVRMSMREAPYTPLWHAEVQGARAEAVMRAVLPYMGARRSARIARVLAHSPVTSKTPPRLAAA